VDLSQFTAGPTEPSQIVEDFIEYNFHTSIMSLIITKEILNRIIKSGIVLMEAGDYFQLVVQICKQTMTQKFPELRDPYTGEISQ